jgi:transposase-like protein
MFHAGDDKGRITQSKPQVPVESAEFNYHVQSGQSGSSTSQTPGQRYRIGLDCQRAVGWVLAKMRLAKFRGLNRATLHLHLKECEFCFNHRRDNLYQLLLKDFKINPLN